MRAIADDFDNVWDEVEVEMGCGWLSGVDYDDECGMVRG